jgi:hypothetical protein
VAEQLEGSFDDSSKYRLAEIHAVPRGHTWREATVAQAPWLESAVSKRRLSRISVLVIGTNSPRLINRP